MLVIGEGVNGAAAGNRSTHIASVFTRGTTSGIVVIIPLCREGACCKVRTDLRSVCKTVGASSDIFVHYAWGL
jgi:hypothetical protein